MTPLLYRLPSPETPLLQLTWNSQPIYAQQGDTVLTAILLARDHLRITLGGKEPRAGFCLMGACQDCWVQKADGHRIRACTTPAEEGMALVDALPGESPCRT